MNGSAGFVSSLATGLLLQSVTGCVVSSGFEEVPAEDNVMVLDGDEVALTQVVAEKQDGLVPWANHRLVRISGRVDDLVVEVDVDSFASGDRQLRLFGEDAAVRSTDGPQSEFISHAVSGVVRVIEGDENRLVVELEDVVLRDVCGGGDRVIASARFASDLKVGLQGIIGVDPGFVGSIEAKMDAGGFSDGPVDVIGIAGGSVFTRNNGQEVFRTETSDACPSREHPLVLVMNLALDELPEPGTPVAFASLPVSAAFLIVVERPGSIFRSATLTRGTLTVKDALSLDNGSVLDAVIEDVTFDEFVDANEDPTGEAPASAERIELHVVMGLPEL